MKVAFHFNAAHPHLEGTLYHLPIQEECFRILLSGSTAQLHLKIFSGDLVIRSTARNQDHLEKLVLGLFNPPYPVWQDLHPDLYDIIYNHRIYVLAFDGMTKTVRDTLNNSLKDYDPYLGAQQIHEANLCHWGLYNQGLQPRYRILDRKLRIFYHAWDKDYGKDDELANHWRHLFSHINFEDLGIRHTIFDSYDSYEHAQRVAALSEMIGEHLAMLADELLLRLGDMNPRLQERMHKTFEELNGYKISEDLSDIAFSCRRMLELFADAVYPPRREKVDGREVTKEKYRNRLWAYIKDQISGKEKELLLYSLRDVGGRVDKLNELANKGVHAKISHRAIQRLILGVIILLYDVSTLAPPSEASSVLPDVNIMKDLLGPNPPRKGE